MDEKEHDINDSFNPVKPPHVGWLSNHHLLGGFILFVAFAAVVAYLYYLSTLQVDTDNLPTHYEQKTLPTGDTPPIQSETNLNN
jgi:hypothetical protein